MLRPITQLLPHLHLFSKLRDQAEIKIVLDANFIFFVRRTAINSNAKRKQVYIKSYFSNNYH